MTAKKKATLYQKPKEILIETEPCSKCAEYEELLGKIKRTIKNLRIGNRDKLEAIFSWLKS
ncbi:MAG TPA: hypothetical protein ENH85_08170 [Candidatus Scalindua sp.]|nr:hypothetical protein [Candidatus Scalindua sp.]